MGWNELGRKDQEIRYGRQEKYFKRDSSGFLKEAVRDLDVEPDISTDLRLKSALQRRGVALQVAQLASYKMQEKWVSKLFMEYNRPPLPHYNKTSLDQLQRADTEFFAELSELTRGNLRPSVVGGLPLDSLIPTVMKDARVTNLLNQLQGKNITSEKADTKGAGSSNEIERLKEELRKEKLKTQARLFKRERQGRRKRKTQQQKYSYAKGALGQECRLERQAHLFWVQPRKWMPQSKDSRV